MKKTILFLILISMSNLQASEISEKEFEAEIQVKVQACNQALEELQGKPETPGSSVFSARKVTYGYLGGVPVSDYFSALVDNGVEPQEVAISVLKTAEYDSVKAASFASCQEPLGLKGTLTFPHVSSPVQIVSFTFDGSENIRDVQTTINARRTDAKVKISFVLNRSGFKLLFRSTDFSMPLVFDKNIIEGEEAFLPDSSVKTKADLQGEIIYGAEHIKHDTSTVKVPGMSLCVLKKTQMDPEAPAFVNIEIDYHFQAAINAIDSFFKAFNELKECTTDYTEKDAKILPLKKILEKSPFKPEMNYESLCEVVLGDFKGAEAFWKTISMPEF